MTSDQVLKHFRETDALLDGHFVLSSGLHSGLYLQCAIALQFPSDAARFGKAIAERVANPGSNEGANIHDSEMPDESGLRTGDGNLTVDTVASPAIGGLVIGYAVAESLNARFIWTERVDGQMTLRRGFALKPGERILIVEDVITTGGSTRECIAALEANGGRASAAASIIDRSNGKANVGVPRLSLATLDVPTFSPDVCPMCAGGIPVVKPGSRAAASK